MCSQNPQPNGDIARAVSGPRDKSGGYERTIATIAGVWFNSEEDAQTAAFPKAQRKIRYHQHRRRWRSIQGGVTLRSHS